MSFQEALVEHLGAIRARNLEKVLATLPSEGPVNVVLPNGSLLASIDELKDFYKEWFDDLDWEISHKVVFSEVSNELGYGVITAVYQDIDDEGESFDIDLTMSVVMRLVDDKWVMVLTQNTELEEVEDEE